MSGPVTALSEYTHARKYRSEGETFREGCYRQAAALKDTDAHFRAYSDILLDMRFLPAGRVQKAIGAIENVTAYNCFVAAKIMDSFVYDDAQQGLLGGDSIMGVAVQAAATMRMGGGIGYDFSTLRPKDDMIKKLRSRSSGPLSFMEIFNAVCLCTASTDNRRGAQMGVLRVDHPDIEEFIHYKQNQDKLRGFNLSIAITDKFMECLETGKPFPLTFNGQKYREVDPLILWDMIMRSTWDWAEPGVLFIDRINDMNNLYYCEEIAATNPCGEQPLPPHGACLLGSFNLVRYLKGNQTMGWSFDWRQLEEDILPVVRAMDNVVDRSLYPLPAQRNEAHVKRRMGLGVTGLANAAEAMGFLYGTQDFLDFQQRVMEVIRNECYHASMRLAMEKGSFALFDADLYSKSKFIRTLPQELQMDIFRFGIRNSHLTSIAPTGTISLCADNVSSGIEPVFSYATERTILEDGGPKLYTVEDYGVKFLGVRGKMASDVTVMEHVKVLGVAARNVDSAVSKTCNIPSSTTFDEFKQVYVDAYHEGAKGCTTFRMDGKRMGILKAKPDEASNAEPEADGAACTIDPTTGIRSCE